MTSHPNSSKFFLQTSSEGYKWYGLVVTQIPPLIGAKFSILCFVFAVAKCLTKASCRRENLLTQGLRRSNPSWPGRFISGSMRQMLLQSWSREKWMLVLHSDYRLSLLIKSWTLIHGTILFIFRMCLLSSIKVLWECPPINTHKGPLDHSKSCQLTIKTDHHLHVYRGTIYNNSQAHWQMDKAVSTDKMRESWFLQENGWKVMLNKTSQRQKAYYLLSLRCGS